MITLPIADIRTDGGTQPRAQMDLAVIAEYAEDIGSGATFPPVTVYHDGAAYWLADGFHRLAAYKSLGLVEIPADVRQGTLDDARWYSYSVNQSHGLRRTPQDVRRAIEGALIHPYHPRYTQAQIARHVGVTPARVSQIAVSIKDLIDKPDERIVTRNGQTYTMNTANIGRRETPEPGAAPADLWASPDDCPEDEPTEAEVYEYNRQQILDANRAGFVIDAPPAEPVRPHVAYNAGNNEWYTPPEYILAARQVMGEIDLDPATSEKANEVVGATKIYTAQDDGLLWPWQGRVWMNPPYASELIGKFVDKLVFHVQAGHVPEAIILVNNATETGWFHALCSVASAVIFPRGRVRFWEPGGAISQPLQGQALVYIGPSPVVFLEAYQRLGWGARLWPSN